MPELPEVETVRRSLASVLAGRRIAETTRISWDRTIAEPTPELFRELLRDRLITGVDRRAKYLIIRLDRDEFLVVHLRMTGRLTIEDDGAEPDPHTHVVLRLDGGDQLFFRDTRKFGRIWLLDAEGLRVLQQHLGPEPLDEALWLARLHPLRTVPSLHDEEIDRLYHAVRAVLSSAVERRGTSFSDYRDGWGQPGDNQHFLEVYDRAGQPCRRCGTLIERTVVAQRGTHLCPSCQPLPGA